MAPDHFDVVMIVDLAWWVRPVVKLLTIAVRLHVPDWIVDKCIDGIAHHGAIVELL